MLHRSKRNTASSALVVVAVLVPLLLGATQQPAPAAPLAGCQQGSAGQISASGRAPVPSASSTIAVPTGSVAETPADGTPPAITGFAPTSGPVGTSVVITGSGFTGATDVQFNGTSTSTYFVDSDAQITASVPFGALTGKISVTATGGTSTSLAEFRTQPIVASFTPTVGLSGTSVTITGTAFTGATSVRFNGTSATAYSVDSYTQITASVPSGALTGKISVTAGGTGTSSAKFKVQPTVQSFIPTAGPPGTSVTITGTAFTGATSVRFNGTSATAYSVDSYTQITASVPSGALTGKISVTTSGGVVTSSTKFKVQPTVASFTPTAGPVGSSVTITGVAFTGATAVKFEGVAATFTVGSSTEITASVPAGALTGKISVTTSGGTMMSSSQFMVQPTLTAVTPTAASVGASVVITGSGLAGANDIEFNGTAASSYSVDSDTQITATVPPGAQSGPIGVSTPGGQAVSVDSFTVVPPPVPAIAGFAAMSGPVGTSVVITGSGFTGATDVQFNGTSTSTHSVDSDAQITAIVPPGAQTGPMGVSTSGGQAVSADSFTVTPSPVPAITGFTPSSGPVGTSVVITGSGFTGATDVQFDGTSTSIHSVDSDAQITARVPRGACSGTISVIADGGAANSATSFSVVPIPIQHIVIIDQENHSFDNVLGLWCVQSGRCDGAITGVWPDGTTRALSQATDLVPSVGHQPSNQTLAVDGGKMDGFPNITSCQKTGSDVCMTQFDPIQIPNLVALASTFAVSDRTFEFDASASWGSHLELVAGTNDGFTGYNPGDTDGTGGSLGWGCDSLKTAEWKDPRTGGISQQYSCVPLPSGLDPATGTTTPVAWVPTVMDELDQAGIGWRTYGGGSGSGGYGWAICPTFADCLYTPQASNMADFSQVVTDAVAGALPAVSFVTPSGVNSQHNGHSMAVGDNWIGEVVQAIEDGPDWNSTAIFITYDDCGCFYDHVPPPAGLGIRVPMVIVSPYARPGFTDSNVASYASLLTYVEDTFGLPSLTARDATAYGFAGSFDYQQVLVRGARMTTTPVPSAELRWIADHPDHDGT
jgi:phospholipase C